MKSKRFLKRNEFYVGMTIIILCTLIHLKSGQFFTVNNFVDITRSMIVPGMLAVGLMLEIISGGIDVSFPAIAMLSMYATVQILLKTGYEGPAYLAFIISGLFGLLLGLVNGVLVAWLKLPAFIITLGTGSIYLGFMQAVLKSRVISILPRGIAELSRSTLFTVTNQQMGISSSLPTIFILLPIAVLFVYVLTRYTMLGRGIYALGGDRVACERTGFHVLKIQLFVYGFMGLMSGVVGVTRVVLTGSAQPTTLIGYETTCIAAVVLGGTRLSGGHGNVWGTLLGALLITMVSNSLIMLGIPTYWSKFVTGMLIIAGTSISAYRALKQKRIINASTAEA